MRRYDSGVFQPTNPQKYIGNAAPRFRSSWESTFFHFLDTHPSIIQWASESIRIPYRHPLTGKITTYVPDLLIMYADKNGKTRVELIEIKPSSQTSLQEARSQHDKLHAVINQAKWQAAIAWTKAQGIVFRIVTEHELFGGKYRTRGAKKAKK